MSDDDLVLYDVNKAGLCTITLNRPPVHAFNLELAKAFHDSLIDADNDENVKCILLKSTGKKVFSAGMDIKVHFDDLPPDYAEQRGKYTRDFILKMLTMKKPIVCVVQGSAIGMGLMIIMASDLRIFADRPFPDEMFFRMPEIALNIFPGSGATILPLLTFGLSFAKNILLTSDNFGLEKLINLNIPIRVFSLDDLDAETEKFMDEFVKYKASIMYLIKSSLSIMNKKHMEKWLDLENDCSAVRDEEKSSKEWDAFIEGLFRKYP